MSLLEQLNDAKENFTCDQAGAVQVLPGGSSYEGIPENLLLNFASWVVGITFIAISNFCRHYCIKSC